MKAVTLLSGGVDSTTVLALAVHEYGREQVLALSVYYGQKHWAEIDAAQQVSAHYRVAHRKITIPNIFGDESTVTLGGPDQPQMTYKEIAESVGPSPTVVPFRNANLLSVATAVAIVEGAEWVYAGMHAEDARNWAYPDCTPEFLGAMANAIRVGSYDKVRLATPLMWRMKADVVGLGLDLGCPYELTLSCYDGKVPACGVCPTCVERREAFRANGLVDPIEYEKALA